MQNPGPEAGEFRDVEVVIAAAEEGVHAITFRVDGAEPEPGGTLAAEALARLERLATVEEQGRLLHDLLFAGTLGERWTELEAKSPKRRLRLALDLAAPELHPLPWEALHRGPADGSSLTQALAADDKTPFSRSPWPPGARGAGEPPATRPLRLLAAVASPRDLEDYNLAPLDRETERAALTEALALSVAEDDLELSWVEPPLTLARLDEELRRVEPHLLHLVAHGKMHAAKSLLFLEADDGSAAAVDELEFTDLLTRLGDELRFVFLSSCETAKANDDNALAGFAQRLAAAGLPAVLAMRGKVEIETARTFATTFYRQLTRHGLVDLAVNQARSGLLAGHLPGATLPVLLSSIPEGELFRPRPPSASDEARTLFLRFAAAEAADAGAVRTWLRGKGFRPITTPPAPPGTAHGGLTELQRLATILLPCRALLDFGSAESTEGEGRNERHITFLSGRPIFPLWVGPGAPARPSPCPRPWIDLTTDHRAGLDELSEGLTRAGIDAGPAPVLAEGRPPYPGLFAFDEADAPIFFGREREVTAGREALARMRSLGGRPRLLLILGASGSGKSSLLRAGLLPTLRRDEESWQVLAPFRPGEAPIDALVAARRAGEEARCIVHPPTVVVSIDQLEELFSREGAEERVKERFAEELAALVTEDDLDLLVVATMRSDFLPSFQKHSRFASIKPETLLVGPMDRASLTAVIEKPANVADLELDPELADAMVDDARGEGGLPLLALALYELWRLGKEDGKLTLGEFRNGLGGLEGVVAHVIEEVLGAHKLDGEETKALRLVFTRRLVQLSPEGEPTRRTARWSSLPKEVLDICERMVARRILKSTGEGDARTVEVAHEAVLSWSKLQTWLDEERGTLLQLRKLENAAKTWAEEGRGAIILDRKRLGDYLTLRREERKIEPLADEYLDTALAQQRQRRKRKWLARAGGAVSALVVLLVAYIVAIGPLRTMLRENLNLAWSADGQRLVAGAANGDQRIWNLNAGLEATAVVIPGFLKQPRPFALSADGTRLITTDLLGIDLATWHLRAGGREAPARICRILPHKLAFLAGEEQVAVLGLRKLTLHDLERGTKDAPVKRPWRRFLTALAVHPQQRLLVLGTNSGEISSLLPEGSKQLTCPFADPADCSAGRPIHALAFDPTGRFLAAVDRPGPTFLEQTAKTFGLEAEPNPNSVMGRLRVHTFTDGRELLEVEIPRPGALAWDERGDHLAYSSDRSVFLLEITTKENRELHVDREVLSLAFQPGAPTTLALLDNEGCVTLWDTAADRPTAVLEPGCSERK